jgi:hypothetical protein
MIFDMFLALNRGRHPPENILKFNLPGGESEPDCFYRSEVIAVVSDENHPSLFRFESENEIMNLKTKWF